EYDEDIDIFISRLSSYLASTGIDPVANRDQAFGILRECLHGRALEWFDRKILAQGGEPIGDFYSKLLKYGKMLNLDEQQIKGQFLRGLSPDLEDDAERIGTEQPLADL
ncbi:36715_t:CDS:2, partial [Racocetra persica]